MCERNISKSVKILCAECPASEPGKNELVICLECLRLGKISPDYPDHKSNHDYYVFDNLEFPLLTADWSALQEIRLIQGIMKCGLGNWTDIAEQFLKGHDDNNKSPEECETHYFSLLM
jgi:transcriptional adapter 2-alpha